MKADERWIRGKIMNMFVALSTKMNSYITDDGCIDKKTKVVKKSEIKRKIKFQDFKKYLENDVIYITI